MAQDRSDRLVLNDGHCDYSPITTRNNIGDAVPSNKNPQSYITEVASGRRICMGGHSTSNQHKMTVFCTYLQSGDWSKVPKDFAMVRNEITYLPWPGSVTRN